MKKFTCHGPIPKPAVSLIGDGRKTSFASEISIQSLSFVGAVDRGIDFDSCSSFDSSFGYDSGCCCPGCYFGSDGDFAELVAACSS
jgi:hypothetical protein